MRPTHKMTRHLLGPALLALAFTIQGCACGGGGAEPTKTEEAEAPETKKDGDSCPDRYKELDDQDGKSKCECPAGLPSGTVWGSGIYTTDSNICAAAIHAGVIKKKKGGKVTVKGAKGCKSYKGSENNGVTSSGWGSYDNSFYFPDKGNGKCDNKKDDKKNDDEGGDSGSADKCPDRFKNIDGWAADKDVKLTCKCKEGQAVGSVYGTGVYTNDSSICAAAVHAGVIEKDGGKVKVKSFEGCKKYKASDKNGINTSGWGQYDSSFYFPKAGEPECD